MSDKNCTAASKPEVRTLFAKNLKAARIRAGFMMVRMFAAKLDIDETRYTRYERAEAEPELTMLVRICDALDVTPNELLGNTEERALLATTDS